MNKTNINTLVGDLLASLGTRQKAILRGRYGLQKKERVTLASLGNHYGITRERVRQIESLALDSVRRAMEEDDFNSFVSLIENYLRNAGGVRREDFLLNDLRKLVKATKAQLADNQLRFLLEASGRFKYAKESNTHEGFWYLNSESKERALSFVKKLIATLKPKKNDILESTKEFERIFSSFCKNEELKEEIAMNYATLSKRFAINPYGEFGLSHWAEVHPKTSRDWAHLVLRKEKKPMHFTEIAKVVNQLKDGKDVHHQTIHNELIKDEKFVLVGKGIYGLQELGLIAGTAREVIKHLIRAHGPLKSRKVVSLVLKERFLKPNTILINLQNKKHFERLGDGRYTIREA